MNPPNAPRIPSTDGHWQTPSFERGRSMPTAQRGLDHENPLESRQQRPPKREYSTDKLISEAVRPIPSQPRPVQLPTWYGRVFDFVIAGSPLVLLIVVGIALGINGKVRSSQWDWMLDAVLLAPSIFPVLFAGFTARALASIALYVATKGTTFGTLEQLHGSQTLGGAIMTTYALRSISLATVGLLGLWAFSPLGGQAALRMLRVDSQFAPTEVLYRHPYQAPDDKILQEWGKPAADDMIFNVAVLTSGALIGAPRFHSNPRDVYGNIRIPLLEALDTKDADSEGWITVKNDSSATYSSLLGVPMAVDTPTKSILKFNIESRYIYFDCFESTASMSASSRHTLGPINEWDSMESQRARVQWMGAPARQYFQQPYYLNPNRTRILDSSLDSTNLPRAIVSFLTTNERESHDNITRYEKKDVSQTLCAISTTHVESRVICEFGDCAVRSARHSRLPHLSPNITDLDLDSGAGISFFHYLGVNFVSKRPFELLTMTEIYLLGLSNLGSRASTIPGISTGLSAVVANVNLQDLSQRFTTLYNGFYDAFRTPYAFVGVEKSSFEGRGTLDERVWRETLTKRPDFEKLKDYFPARQNDEDFPFRPQVVEGVVENLDAIYRIDARWAVAYTISVIVLAAISIIGAIFRNTTLTPDILLYISSLTRDNPYTSIPEEADSSALSGDARARLLAKVPVVLTDVTPNAEYGHIALATLNGKDEDGETKVRDNGKKTIKKGRMFW